MNIFTLPRQTSRGSPLSPANSGAPAADETQPPVQPDRGCNLAASCLDCPLPTCKYDGPAARKSSRARPGKDQAIAKTIYEEKLSAEQAAERFQVTVRTIYRILGRAGKAAGTYPREQEFNHN